MFDTSSFGKFLVQGRDALAVLERLSIRQIDVPVGRVVYTQWLNEFAGIEADVTVTRLAESEFLVLSGPGTVLRDLARVRRAIDSEESCTVTDVSGAMAMISVMGPNSRALLQSLTDADLSNEAFPFATSREIDLGFGHVRATRLTFVGELGWELLIPTDLARAHLRRDPRRRVTRTVCGRAGYYAMNSLGWRRPTAAGDTTSRRRTTRSGPDSSFGIAWDKPGGFVGREALARIREAGVDRRLMQFVLADPEPMLFHDEPVYRDGVMVGRVEAAQYGYTLGGAVALGWVQAPGIEADDWFTQGCYEIQVPDRSHRGHGVAAAPVRPDVIARQGPSGVRSDQAGPSPSAPGEVRRCRARRRGCGRLVPTRAASGTPRVCRCTPSDLARHLP